MLNSIVVGIILAIISNIEAVEFRYLKALPCPGRYNPGGLHTEYLRFLRLKQEVEIEDGFVKAERDELTAFYLGPSKMLVEECDFDTEKCIIKGVIPVPIRSSMSNDIECSIQLAMSSDRERLNTWTGSIITDRDRGIFDNLSVLFRKFSLPNARKQIFDDFKLKKKNSEISPYHAFKASLEEHTGFKIMGLLLEVADTINEVSLSLGAAVLLAKKDVAEDWRLTVSNYREVVKKERGSDEAMIIDCYIDELLGLHMATNIPVIISKSLYDRVSIDGLLERVESDDSTRLLTPYFDNDRDANNWKKQLEASRAKPPKPVPKVTEISDASTFLRMRLSEKRACLRASGIYALPRPREGARKVDAIMIPLLDEEVAYEVLRRLGETRGDFKSAAKMQDYESRKPHIAKQYSEAKKKGDDQRAKELCEELNALATLAFDPSNPDADTPKGGFDIEEWYWEQRKRVYGIVAA